MENKNKMRNISDLLKKKVEEYVDEKEKKVKSQSYVSQEFQDYGLRLANRLGDIKHKALYIMYAKRVPRALLDDAIGFASDYPKAKDKGKIFMWKISELLKAYKETHPDFEIPKMNSKKAKSSTKPKKDDSPKAPRRSEKSQMPLF